MKRILSLVLILILSLGVLSGCQFPIGPNTPDTPDAPTYDLENAKGYLKDLYPNLLPTKEVAVPSTIANFNVTKVLGLKDGKYTVAWSTNVESVQVVDYVSKEEGDIFNAENTATVKVVMGSEDVNYTLTATITAPDNTTATVEFNLVVPKLDCNTHEEYMAATKGEEVMVKGIVVAINSVKLGNKYNHVFLADTEVAGGYYCYSITADPEELGVKVGMTVAVSGPIEPYSGMQEIKGGQLVIIDDSIKTVEPLDITDKFAAGENLGTYVALPVIIKGVEIGTQDLEKDTSQYLYFSIGEQKGYVRTYVTDFPAGMLTANDKTAIDEDHAAHFGYKADVTGILILYSGAPYLIPMSVTPFTNYVEVVKTPAEKVESEKENLKVETSFTADATLSLPLVGTNYDDVTISWTSDNAAIVIAEDGTATITVPDTKTVVKLTATFVCGEATATKEIEVTLNKTALTAGQAIEIGAAMEHNTYTDGKYLIAGVITEVYNETYGNMKITDELGNVLTVYGSYSADGSTRYDAMETKPVVGDYVVVLGTLGQYSGTAQTKNAWIISWTTPTTIPSANEIASSQEHNTYTSDKYLVTGVVQADVNTTYGNMYIQDAEGNQFYIYGLYDQAGNRYDKMSVKPVEGDTVTVLTVLGQYSNKAQGKNATLVAHTVATPDQGGEDGGEDVGGETPEVPSTTGKIELTVDSLGLASQSYTSTTATVGGVGFEWIQLGNYGDGIQVRDKDGNTSSLWNTTAFPAAIKSIELVASSTKSTYDNADCAIYTFGNAVDNHTCTVKLTTVKGTSTYTITPDAETYTFFRFEHDLSYTQYWESITIVLVNGDVVTPPAGGDDSGDDTTGGDDTTETHTCADADGDYVCDTADCGKVVAPAEGSTLTIEQALKLGALYVNDTGASYANWYYVTGVIADAPGSTYGGCTLTDGTNSISVYGLKDSTGANRYDAMEVKPVKGDTVKLYGQVGAYYQGIQMNNSNVIELTAHGEEHNYVDGKCTKCFAAEPVAGSTTLEVSIADIASANSWANGIKYESFVYEGVTFKTSGTDANTGKYYTSDNTWRVYPTGNGTLTITAPEGKTITSVTVVLDKGGFTYDGTALTSGSAMTVSGNSITLTSANTTTEVKSIVIIYQ